jgi:hypothetical protein
MIWIAPILMLLVFVTIEIHVLRLVDGDAHERCLKNIGRLESELFPDLPSELRWATWPPRSSVRSHPSPYGAAQVSIPPGARWPVANPNYVQILMPHVSSQVQREMLLENDERRRRGLGIIPSDSL